jgi:hypothetical protein
VADDQPVGGRPDDGDSGDIKALQKAVDDGTYNRTPLAYAVHINTQVPLELIGINPNQHRPSSNGAGQIYHRASNGVPFDQDKPPETVAGGHNDFNAQPSRRTETTEPTSIKTRVSAAASAQLTPLTQRLNVETYNRRRTRLFRAHRPVTVQPTGEEQTFIHDERVLQAIKGVDWFTQEQAVDLFRKMREFLQTRLKSKNPRNIDPAVYDMVFRASSSVLYDENDNRQVLRDLSEFLQYAYAYRFYKNLSGLENKGSLYALLPVLLKAYNHVVGSSVSEAA